MYVVVTSGNNHCEFGIRNGIKQMQILHLGFISFQIYCGCGYIPDQEVS